ncbi:unnamed protein product [Heligmosomoides polygyrus]|uniref:Uncharacterized protein n=1 Tax=Heligmosomoides polygyrus TaxID=6339 RepID=A0A183FV32_HELPZ|nr:unnamed protein product [Heligmosomoides polygyrus]
MKSECSSDEQKDTANPHDGTTGGPNGVNCSRSGVREMVGNGRDLAGRCDRAAASGSVCISESRIPRRAHETNTGVRNGKATFSWRRQY